MSDVDISAYENGWKPKFNKKKYKELLNNTPTCFKFGDKIINMRIEIVKSLIISCSHLNQKQDLNSLCTGDEGSGKSHLSFQLAYIKHRLLTLLGMINYPFSLDLIYYNVNQIIEAFDKYAHIPYMIFVLDESDSLTRNKWNDPIVKLFLSKMRRERKNLRVVIMNMPQLSELLPTVTLTRITFIYEVKLKTIKDKIQRGQFNLFTIPRGSSSFSTYHDKFLDKNLIKNTIAKKLYAKEERYFNLPKNIMSMQGNFNGVSPINEKEYLKRAIKSNKEEKTEDITHIENENKLITSIEKYDTINSMRGLSMTWEQIGDIYNTTKDNIRLWVTGFEKRNTKSET